MPEVVRENAYLVALGLFVGIRRYRKLVLNQGRIKGAILLGHPQEATAVVRAAKDGLDMSSYVEDLKAGRWDVIPE